MSLTDEEFKRNVKLLEAVDESLMSAMDMVKFGRGYAFSSTQVKWFQSVIEGFNVWHDECLDTWVKERKPAKRTSE